MKRLLLALLLLVLLGGSASASDYVFRDGYYWLNGKAYTRTFYQQAGYWSCGRYYPGPYVYAYHQVDVEKPAAKVLSYTDPAWRTKMLELKAQMIEQDAFVASAKALGLYVPPVLYEMYGAGSLYSGVPAVQGNTQFGQSFNQLNSYYSGLQPMEFMAQASRHIESAMQAFKEGQAGHQAMTSDALKAVERFEAMRLRIGAAKEILAAIEGTSQKAELRTYQWKVVPQGDASLKVERDDSAVPPATKESLAKQWAVVANDKCASCHGDKDAKGGFKIATYPQLSMPDKLKVWERLVSPDENKMMPRDPSGRPGRRVSEAELRLFLTN